MSNVFRNLRPPYPVFDSTPIFGGGLPTIDEIGPPDMRPSGLNPYYDLYRGAHGRNIAGLGSETTMMDSSDIGIKNYANELDSLAQADDVQGNGVFDPAGTQGNIHPDYGVFADHQSLPGYIPRSRDYSPSEVIDATTGQPVMYVPGGAVAIDQSQLDTYRERQLLWELPPGSTDQLTTTPDFGDTWIPREEAWGVSGLGAEAEPPRSRAGLVAGFAIAGMAIGIFAATLIRK